MEATSTSADEDPVGRTKAPRQTFRGLVLMVLALVAMLWYLNSPSVVEVAEAEAGLTGVTTIVNTCGGDLSADVYEDDLLVRIKVLDHRFRIRFGGNDCLDAFQTPLSVPLGDRMLVDDATGRQIPVGP